MPVHPTVLVSPPLPGVPLCLHRCPAHRGGLSTLPQPPLLLRAAAVDAEGRHVPAALQPPLQAALERGPHRRASPGRGGETRAEG